jgi:hypothetical protein
MTDCADKFCKPFSIVYEINSWFLAACSWNDHAYHLTLILEKLRELLVSLVGKAASDE